MTCFWSTRPKSWLCKAVVSSVWIQWVNSYVTLIVSDIEIPRDLANHLFIWRVYYMEERDHSEQLTKDLKRHLWWLSLWSVLSYTWLWMFLVCLSASWSSDCDLSFEDPWGAPGVLGRPLGHCGATALPPKPDFNCRGSALMHFPHWAPLYAFIWRNKGFSTARKLP